MRYALHPDADPSKVGVQCPSHWYSSFPFGCHLLDLPAVNLISLFCMGFSVFPLHSRLVRTRFSWTTLT